MKSNIVFAIREETIQFLQVSPLPKTLISGIEILDCHKQNDGQISQTLLNFVKLRKINFKDTRVTLVIPRSRAILRHMVFPSHDEKEILSMINLQVGSRIPYAREEVEIDFQVISKSPDGYAKVAVVIIPQDIVMRYWKIFNEAQIPLSSITISSIGLWLLYQQQPDTLPKPGAIIDLDINHSEICVCTKDNWLTSREISIGFDQMQATGYEEILKQWELTLTNSNSEKPIEITGPVILVSTANRSYALGIEIAKVYPELIIKENVLTDILSLSRSLKWPKAIAEDGMSVASLVGVGLSTEKPPIDLTPQRVRLAQEQSFYQRQLVILGLSLLAALISLSFAFGVDFFKKNVALANLESQLHAAKHQAMDVELQLQKIHNIEAMIKGRLIFSDLVTEIYRLLPTQVYLVNVTITDRNTLSLQGMSSNSVEINQFQKDMDASSQFTNVSLDYVNKRVTQQGEVDYFKITCTLKSVSGHS